MNLRLPFRPFGRALLGAVCLSTACAPQLRAACTAPPAEPVDTLAKVLRPDSVVVVQNDSAVLLTVYGRQGDSAYVFRMAQGAGGEQMTTIGEHASNWDFSVPLLDGSRLRGKDHEAARKRFEVTGFSNFRLGVAVPVAGAGDVGSHCGLQAGFDVVDWAMHLPDYHNAFHLGLSLGTNLLWQPGERQWVRQGGRVSTWALRPGTTHARSLLQTLSVGLPVSFSHDFRKLTLRLTVTPEWRQAVVKNRYTIDGLKYRDTYRNLNVRRFSAVTRLSLYNKKWGGFYVEYDPFKLFTGARGLNCRMLSVGFTF